MCKHADEMVVCRDKYRKCPATPPWHIFCCCECEDTDECICPIYAEELKELGESYSGDIRCDGMREEMT
jgi:hypothetical protein